MTAQEKVDKILEITELELNDFAMKCGIIPNSLKAAIKRDAITDDIITKIHDRFGVRKGFFKDGKEPIIDINHASVQNEPAVAEIPTGVNLDEQSRRLLQIAKKTTEYAFVPKTILEGEYRIELQSELEDRRKERAETAELYKKLIKKLEDEIAELRAGKPVTSQSTQ
jgi:plasmid maintenance system antidote protein VapI